MKLLRLAIPLTLLIAVVFLALPTPDVLLETAEAQEKQPPEVQTSVTNPTSPSYEDLGLAITYQGHLERNGQPVNATCEMTFDLWAAETGTPWVDSDTKTVQVIDGLFTTELTFDPCWQLGANRRCFTGLALWMSVAVECNGVREELTPRQAITAVPYAQSLMPGAIVARTASSNHRVQLGGDFPVRVDTGGTGIFVHASGTGVSVASMDTGVGVQVGGAGNAFVSEIDSQYASIYSKNEGSGTGAYSYTRSGTAVKAYSYSGNLFEGYEELTVGGNTERRFKVTYSGNVYADGTYSSPAADFAEMLPAVESLEPGDVLVIGEDGKLMQSIIANAENVAGVFATQPAFVGGLTDDSETSSSEDDLRAHEESLPSLRSDDATAEAQPQKDNKVDALASAYEEHGLVPLSIAGIVPVKVSAENGAILPGDLLTSASLPGHAMKAAPVDLGGVNLYRPGTIIGKALEPLEKDTGVIEVLVTLQ